MAPMPEELSLRRADVTATADRRSGRREPAGRERCTCRAGEAARTSEAAERRGPGESRGRSEQPAARRPRRALMRQYELIERVKAYDPTPTRRC